MGNQVKLGLPIKFDDDAFIVLVVGRPPPDPQESPDGGLASEPAYRQPFGLAGFALAGAFLTIQPFRASRRIELSLFGRQLSRPLLPKADLDGGFGFVFVQPPLWMGR